MTGDLERPSAAPQAPPPAPAGLGDSKRKSEPDTKGVTPTPHEVDAERAERLTSFADFHHQYVGQYIQLADSKAAATFALTSGVTAFLLNAPGYADALKLDATWQISGLAILSFLFLNLSSLTSFSVIVPRLPKGGDGLIFWKTVAELPSGADYVNKIASLPEGSLAAERVSHCYNLSSVCSRKYSQLRRAMIFAGWGVLTTFLYWLTQPHPVPS